MILNAKRFLLAIILFLTISQFGKHFWPYFAYVSGIRVDYLAPTIYITDLFILILAILSLPDLYSFIKKRHGKVSIWILMTVGVLCLGIIHAKYALPALFGAGKVIEMIFLGSMIVRLGRREDLPAIASLFSLAIVIQAIIVGLQLSTQSSVGGIWYLLGERTFSSSSIGIATATFWGNETLRAYGTFPHPNVLSFFIVLSTAIVMTHYSNLHNFLQKMWFTFTLGISTLLIISTFSRVGIFLFVALVLFYSIKRMVPRNVAFIIMGIVGLSSIILTQRFVLDVLNSEEVILRIELFYISWEIIKENVFLGVGINNFFYYQIDYQRQMSAALLQPPHNILLLIWLHTGLLGLIGALIFLWVTIQKIRTAIKPHYKGFRVLSPFLIFAVLFAGMFDHYLITLQQGMIMLTFALALPWISSENTMESELPEV